MNEKVIKILKTLENELKDKELTLDEELNMVHNSSICAKLNNLFEDKKAIRLSKIISLTSNNKVIELIETYALENGIEVIYDDILPSNIKIDSNFTQYFDEIKNIPLLTREEEYELFKKYNLSNLDEKAKTKDKIVNANLKLVISIAKNYYCTDFDFLDLVQEGNIGLLKAIDKFDYNKGCKFSTYATWWIRQSISKFVTNKSTGLYVPNNAVNALKKIKTELEDIKKAHTVVNEEFVLDLETKMKLAKHANISLTTLDSLLNLPIVTSLDQPALSPSFDSSDYTILDMVTDTNTNVEEEATNKVFYAQLESILNEAPLTDRELKVIKMRYGIGYDRIMHLDDIANEFGITRERVRQIEAKGLHKLRNPIQKRKLEFY